MWEPMDFAPLLLSLQIAATAIVAAGTVGIALAALLARERFPGRDLADALITAPMALPPTVLGYYLLVVLGRHSIIGRTYMAVVGQPIVFTRAGAVCAATVGALPYVVRSGRAALEAVDPVLVHAARTLG